MNEPVLMNETATAAQLGGALRSLMVAVGAYGVGKGWFNEGLVAAVVPLVMIAGPMIWQQVRVILNHRKTVAIVKAVPDSVAQFK